MKIISKYLLLSSIFFGGYIPYSYCQVTDIYSILTERYVDRPINVHKGQLQINSGYRFSILNKKYDVQGDKIDLAKDGAAAVEHLIPLDIRFGILEYVQFTTKINYARTGIRERNTWIFSGDNMISIDELNEYKGMDDLYVGLDLRAPFLPSNLDWTLSGGLFIPIVDHQPDQPKHIQHILTLATDYTQISYYYKNKYNSGVLGGSIGTAFQVSTTKFAFILSGNFSSCLKDGESITWNSRIIDDNFSYYTEGYEYNTGQQLDLTALFAYQVIDWFAATGTFTMMNGSGGWTTGTGKKIGLREESLMTAGIGYEILTSPNLRIFQSISFPVKGENILGPLVINTGLSVNFVSQSYYNIF